MKKLFLLVILLSLLIPIEIKAEEIGSISGRVIDKDTQQPLPGVNVILVDTQRGDVTDKRGYYEIENLAIGSYNIKFSMMGYEIMAKNNIIVKAGRSTSLWAELSETVLEGEEIVVTGTYFPKDRNIIISTQELNYEEIRSSPGGVEDVQRVVQSLPSVVSGSDQDNEIITRGGEAGENLFLLGEIEIPNPNHFGHQGAGGGPISMVNNELIRKIEFMAGAFPAKYGGRISSVLHLTMREGDRKHYTGNLNLSMAGAGLLLEGPINQGKGSFIFSARKSYLDLIKGSIGLTAVPHYYNLQTTIAYDLNNQHQLQFNGLFGKEHIKIEEEEGYSRGASKVVSHCHTYAGGLTLKSLWWKSGYSLLTISNVSNSWDADVKDSSDREVFSNKSTDYENSIKLNSVFKLNKSNEISFGGSYKPVGFNHQIWAAMDTLFMYSLEEGQTDVILDTIRYYPDMNVEEDISTYKTNAYLQYRLLLKNFVLNVGVNASYFDYLNDENLNIAPRIGMRFIIDDKWSCNLAYGDHYQIPPYVLLTNHPNNRNLLFRRSQHYVIGLEYLLYSDVRLVLETYYKEFNNFPIRKSSLTADYYDHSDEFLSTATGEAYGIEFFLQKKFTGSYYSTLSYSYSESNRHADGIDRPDYDVPSDYDYRNVFTVIFGWRPNNKYEFSTKWRYTGGRPYTPQWYDPLYHKWVIYYDNDHNGIADGEMGVNSVRYPAYHRWDIRFDYRHYIFSKWNLITYFEIENVYNRSNIWSYLYDEDDGTIEEVYQFKFFPVGGVKIEF